MLHTRTHKSRMAIKNEPLMFTAYTGCIGCTKMVERISATIGQENITRPNERNVEQK